FVERGTDHRPWMAAEVSWPSKRRFSLAGADLTGPLEMAGRYRWNRHDLSDAFGSKDHSEIARADPWPFWRRAGLFRSLPCFAGTFGFAQQPSGDRTSPSRCFVIRRRHEPSERARDIEFFNSQADRRAGIDALGFAFDRHAENLCRCGCAHAHSSQLRSRTHRARLWQFGVPLFGGTAVVRGGGREIDQAEGGRGDGASRTHRGSLGVAGVVAAWKFDRVDSHRSAGGYSFGDRLPMFDSQIFRLLFQKSGRLDFA